jgi:hypothetical protein
VGLQPLDKRLGRLLVAACVGDLSTDVDELLLELRKLVWVIGTPASRVNLVTPTPRHSEPGGRVSQPG